jgi:hypothetical protein
MSEHNAVGGIYHSHSDKFLVMAHGTADEVATAKRVLETTGAAHIAAHQGVLTP